MALLACGQRGGESEYEDVFGGTWDVKEINCRESLTSPPSETYRMSIPVTLFKIKFEGRTFSYSVELSDGCQTNINGVKSAEYKTASSGTIGFFDVGTNASRCSAALREATGTPATNVNVPFGITEIISRNLLWELKTDGSIEVGLPLSFKGSEAGPCGGSCLCSLEMVKTD